MDAVVELGDGRERVLTFNLPLPLSLVGPLAEAIEATLREEGWTDVQYVMDGAYVVATRRPRRTTR